jgi:hypothetical protein
MRRGVTMLGICAVVACGRTDDVPSSAQDNTATDPSFEAGTQDETQSDAASDPGNADAAEKNADAGDATTPHALAGINFPPTQGDSGTGAFLPGVYNWGYTVAQIAAANRTFESMRLPINVATANDPAALAMMKAYVDQFGGRAIICMFGTITATSGTHGTGKVDNLQEVSAAWAKIHAVFASYPDVHYELFNEPFGYSKADPSAYVSEMKSIVTAAGLPPAKCIVDGMGSADDVQLVAAGGWTGDVAFHFYPSWSKVHTQSAYSNMVQSRLGALAPRTWITEFGGRLSDANPCYDTYVDGNQPDSADVNTLRGLDDALRALKAKGMGVKGAFHWHGWHNNDSYDYWASGNTQGACKIRRIQAND